MATGIPLAQAVKEDLSWLKLDRHAARRTVKGYCADLKQFADFASGDDGIPTSRSWVVTWSALPATSREHAPDPRGRTARWPSPLEAAVSWQFAVSLATQPVRSSCLVASAPSSTSSERPERLPKSRQADDRDWLLEVFPTETIGAAARVGADPVAAVDGIRIVEPALTASSGSRSGRRCSARMTASTWPRSPIRRGQPGELPPRAAEPLPRPCLSAPVGKQRAHSSTDSPSERPTMCADSSCTAWAFRPSCPIGVRAAAEAVLEAIHTSSTWRRPTCSRRRPAC
jgi:hypothetical protein